MKKKSKSKPSPLSYQKRVYRHHIDKTHEGAFEVTFKETNLYIHAPEHLKSTATQLVGQCRGYIENFIDIHPEFLKTLIPWPHDDPAPEVVRKMIAAGRKAGTGPMAAVAGAVADFVGRGLLLHTDQVVVENGGDVFLKVAGPATVGIFAGTSPLSMKIGIKLPEQNHPMAVCTSSATVGHSLSMGTADAVCVVSPDCPLADAAATAIGNRVQSSHHIRKAIEFGKTIDGVAGIVIIHGKHMGAWGDLEVVALHGKKG